MKKKRAVSYLKLVHSSEPPRDVVVRHDRAILLWVIKNEDRHPFFTAVPAPEHASDDRRYLAPYLKMGWRVLFASDADSNLATRVGWDPDDPSASLQEACNKSFRAGKKDSLCQAILKLFVYCAPPFVQNATKGLIPVDPASHR